MGSDKNHTPCGQRVPQDKSPRRKIRHLHAAPLPHPAYSAEKARAARKGIGGMEEHHRALSTCSFICSSSSFIFTTIFCISA